LITVKGADALRPRSSDGVRASIPRCAISDF
jgi:hypothetical protein